MYKFIAIAVFLAGIAILTDRAEAALNIERVALSSGDFALVIKGDFEFSDDPSMLEHEVAATDAKIVSFDSGGGNIKAAMAFGRAIRRLNLDTYQPRSAECASACTLAFVGGVNRIAEPGAIGVHRASFAGDGEIDGHAAVAAVQSMTADIMTYLIEMGVDPKLLQLSLSVDSSDMRYLTASEMSEYRVTTSGDGRTTVPLGAEHDSAPAPAPIEPTNTPAANPLEKSADQRASDFIARYHDAWSQDNPQALAAMEAYYGRAATFYGKSLNHAEIIDEKRKFAARWPLRAYWLVPGSEQISCDVQCSITAHIEWFAVSPERAKTSSGEAEFFVIWNPSTNLIESETGAVVSTDKKPTAPNRLLRRWAAENDTCRGSSGDNPATWDACKRRDTLGSKLTHIGWCYGREGEAGYQMDWHVCGQ